MVDALLGGEARRGASLHRPPGHHATRSRAMGFCLFNAIAVAAQHALDAHGLDRVLILDWDVHHGNGTNDIFHATDRVLFVSIHESPLYPGTGPASDTGSGPGEGFTVNLPVPGGSGDETWCSLVEHAVVPLARAYRPRLVLVSAGFDAHLDDPLAGCARQRRRLRRDGGLGAAAGRRPRRAARAGPRGRLRARCAGPLAGRGARGRGRARPPPAPELAMHPLAARAVERLAGAWPALALADRPLGLGGRGLGAPARRALRRGSARRRPRSAAAGRTTAVTAATASGTRQAGVARPGVSAPRPRRTGTSPGRPWTGRPQRGQAIAPGSVVVLIGRWGCGSRPRAIRRPGDDGRLLVAAGAAGAGAGAAGRSARRRRLAARGRPRARPRPGRPPRGSPARRRRAPRRPSRSGRRWRCTAPQRAHAEIPGSRSSVIGTWSCSARSSARSSASTAARAVSLPRTSSSSGRPKRCWSNTRPAEVAEAQLAQAPQEAQAPAQPAALAEARPRLGDGRRIDAGRRGPSRGRGSRLGAGAGRGLCAGGRRRGGLAGWGWVGRLGVGRGFGGVRTPVAPAQDALHQAAHTERAPSKGASAAEYTGAPVSSDQAATTRRAMCSADQEAARARPSTRGSALARWGASAARHVSRS